jgi:hypothetical protein
MRIREIIANKAESNHAVFFLSKGVIKSDVCTGARKTNITKRGAKNAENFNHETNISSLKNIRMAEIKIKASEIKNNACPTVKTGKL